MTAHDIEQAVIAAGFAVYEADEYADGVKMIVSKSETFTLMRQYYFGSSYQEITAPVWFACIGILYMATANEIAESLGRMWREDSR